MADLVARYVHQVGRYVPPKERAEIEAELRSMIQDQLDDRYGGAPTQSQVADVLTELGDPRQMAASYASEQYLIGPEAYPYMMMILRHGWVIIPSIVVFLNVFARLTSNEDTTLLDLLMGTVFGAIEATFIFTAVVVLIIALIEHSGMEFEEEKAKRKAFNPLDLPEIDDPTTVDRFEGAFGIAAGTFVTLILVYFLRVGGLTLRFNLSDPGEVVRVSSTWLTLLIMAGVAQLVIQLFVMQRNRWGIRTWLLQTVFEVFGAVCLYFAVLQPLFDHFGRENPSLLEDVTFFERGPEIFAIGYSIIALASRGSSLIKLWAYRKSNPVVGNPQTNT